MILLYGAFIWCTRCFTPGKRFSQSQTYFPFGVTSKKSRLVVRFLERRGIVFFLFSKHERSYCHCCTDCRYGEWLYYTWAENDRNTRINKIYWHFIVSTWLMLVQKMFLNIYSNVLEFSILAVQNNTRCVL